MTSYTLYLLFAALITLILAAVCNRRGAVPGARQFALLMLAATVWSAAYGFEISSKDLAGITFWVRIEYIGIVLIPVFWLGFTLQYTGQHKWLTRRNWIIITIEPLLALVLFWTNSAHELFWKDVELVESGNMTLATFTHGPGFWVHAAYTYLLLLAGMVLIVKFLIRSHILFRKQGISLLVGVFSPWLGNAVYLLGIHPIPYLDPTPFAFVITGLAITWGLVRYQLLEVIPIAQTALIADLPDGVIVLDTRSRIVDINPAAVQIFTRPSEGAIGQNAQQFFRGHEQILLALSSDSATSTEVVIGGDGKQRYYDLRAQPLRDSHQNISGLLIILRDVTHQRISEETIDRRGAILEAVSFTATKFLATLTWEEFIHEALKRLGESATASRVYIFENERSQDGSVLVSQRYEWVAVGITPQIDNPELQGFNLRERGFIRWEKMLGQGQPVYGIVDEFPASEQEVLRAQDILAIAIVPIFVGEEWWGFLGYDDCVTRRQWSKVEIDALEAAAGIIGSSIQRKAIDDQQRRRSNELASLYEVSLELTSSQEAHQLLRTIVAKAVELTGGTGGGLYLCDRKKREVRCVTSTNTKKDFSGTVLKYGEGASGIVAETGKPLIIDDYRVWEGRATVYEENQPFRSVLSAPLNWQGEVIGVIHILHNQETSRFDENDLRLLTLFANQAAIALHNAQTYEIAQQRARRIALLNEITNSALTRPDLHEMLQILANRLCELMDADSVYIALWDEAQQCTSPAVYYSKLQKEPPTFQLEPGEMTMTESVLRAGHPLEVEDVRNTPYLSPRIAALFPTRSMLSLPLIADEQKIGAAHIGFDHPHSFTQEEIELGEQAASQIALAMAKTRMLENEHRRVSELDALRATMADISGELELSALLRIILERATSLLNATGGDLGLYEEERGEILIVVSHNMGKDYQGTRMALGEGAMGLAVKENAPVVISDYHRWEGRSPQYEGGSWEAVLAVPLYFHGRIVGALGIVDKNPKRKFNQDDQRLLNLFAQQAATAIENARLYADEKKRVYELQTLFESSATITKTLDLEVVYKIAAEQLLKAVDATSVYILSPPDLTSSKATVLAHQCGPQANIYERNPDIGATYDMNQFAQTLAALRAGEPLTISVNDPNIDRSDWEELTKNVVKSTICVPMIVSGQLLGYAEIWESRYERTWSAEEVRLCQTISNLAAVAIENARLYQKMQHLAVTDALTGIYNRRGLFDIGQREINRARRFVRPLSVIMLDIDHFKQINDVHSHAIGDTVLQAIVKQCQANLRDMDILGRYGGEEFAILLPETDLMAGYQVAERLRMVIASNPVPTEHGPIEVTVSMGIASATVEIENLAVLLDRADTAMYAAKEAGRNRVVIETSTGRGPYI